ncbi:putative glycoside hydrolase [Pseudonocardia broussonetiae]|uniref:Glycosyl hydrolase-like family 15 (GHL15) protein n=1 Tax=Pseudonocardia broussonetiae TaxID=2736640 RepID=A0A6M6JKR0_9PSEU|nr:putative glycoside hydrolase [Pseudonocardia broussonetiae]QJY47019.1 hypothetical protein HOP40_15330 [Pseudonocardia broussonetiae]
MRRAGLVIALVLVLAGACAAGAAAPRGPAGDRCALWYGIGDTPTDAELDDAAGRYGVVVLNAWETAALRRIKDRAPDTTVLVYKDLSSTRDYAGALRGPGEDAERLPTGVGFARAEREEPGWFARDSAGARIEWGPYPQHWQMAVWDPSYQRAWAQDVTAEAVEQGWDGVFADNDFASLRFYSDAVLEGTADAAATDRLVRDGLDGLVTTAGEHLAAEGKVFVPNVSEARLFPGRWTTHSRFGGAMDENFALRGDDGLLTWQGAGWTELLATAADPDRLTLLVTAGGEAQARTGDAAAALLAAPGTCWSASTEPGYLVPEWTRTQELTLGATRGPAREAGGGVWVREFARGWAAVNPTTGAVDVDPPAGLATADGAAVRGTLRLEAGDGVLLVRPPV